MGVASNIRMLYRRSGISVPEKAIRELVHRLHKDYGKIDPPFIPEVYCEMCRVEVERVKLEDCDARLTPIQGGYIAEVSKDQPKQRQNFSLCHEVAHTFFSVKGSFYSPDILNCSISYVKEARLEERLCNIAASELLMPEQTFRTVASDHLPSLSAVWKVGKIFNTSAQAVSVRIADLDIWPCMFACVRPLDSEVLELGFEIKWWHQSPSAFDGDLSSNIVLYCLRQMLCTPRGLKALGVWEAFMTGHQSEGEIHVVPFQKRFSVQSFKVNQYGKPFVFMMITRRQAQMLQAAS